MEKKVKLEKKINFSPLKLPHRRTLLIIFSDKRNFKSIYIWKYFKVFYSIKKYSVLKRIYIFYEKFIHKKNN